MSRDDLTPPADGVPPAGAPDGRTPAARGRAGGTEADDDVLDPALGLAAAAWRDLRDPVEPPAALDARIRAAAAARVRQSGGGRVPVQAGVAPADGHAAGQGGQGRASASGAVLPTASVRRASPARYAAWGLAMAAGIAFCVVLVRPTLPIAPPVTEAPAPAMERASASDAAEAAAFEPTEAAPPPPQSAEALETSTAPSAPPGVVDAATQVASTRDAATRDAATRGAATQEVGAPIVVLPESERARPVPVPPSELPRALPSVSITAEAAPEPPAAVANTVPVRREALSEAKSAAPPAAAARVARDELAGARADVPAAAAPTGALSAPSAPMVARLRDEDLAPEVLRELRALRSLQRAGDPSLPARLREFVERHPGHPLARTDPALAALLAR